MTENLVLFSECAVPCFFVHLTNLCRCIQSLLAALFPCVQVFGGILFSKFTAFWYVSFNNTHCFCYSHDIFLTNYFHFFIMFTLSIHRHKGTGLFKASPHDPTKSLLNILCGDVKQVMGLGMHPSYKSHLAQPTQDDWTQQCNCHDCHFHLKWQLQQLETQQSYCHCHHSVVNGSEMIGDRPCVHHRPATRNSHFMASKEGVGLSALFSFQSEEIELMLFLFPNIPDIVVVAQLTCPQSHPPKINLVIVLSKKLFGSPLVISMPYLPFRMHTISLSLLQELRNSFVFLMSYRIPSMSLIFYV